MLYKLAASRFWTELEKMPINKRVQTIRKLWVKNFDVGDKRKLSGPMYLKNKFDSNNTIGLLNTHYLYGGEKNLKDSKDFYEDLKRSFRKADKEATNTIKIKRKQRDSKLDKFDLKAKKRTKQHLKQFDKNDDSYPYFAHAGSKHYLEDFMKGNNLGYRSANDDVVFGIQTSRSNSPLSSSAFDEFTNKALKFGDIPATITGKAKATKFNTPHNDYNSTLMGGKNNVKGIEHKIKEVAPESLWYESQGKDVHDAIVNAANKHVDMNKYKNVAKKIQVRYKRDLLPGSQVVQI